MLLPYAKHSIQKPLRQTVDQNRHMHEHKKLHPCLALFAGHRSCHRAAVEVPALEEAPEAAGLEVYPKVTQRHHELDIRRVDHCHDPPPAPQFARELVQ